MERGEVFPATCDWYSEALANRGLDVPDLQELQPNEPVEFHKTFTAQYLPLLDLNLPDKEATGRYPDCVCKRIIYRWHLGKPRDGAKDGQKGTDSADARTWREKVNRVGWSSCLLAIQTASVELAENMALFFFSASFLLLF